MSPRFVDLSQSTTALPDPMVLDTSVVAPYLAALSRQLGVPIRHERDLLKHDPSVLQRYAGQLAGLREALMANNLGISAIVTMDRDMLRALVDFDVYTWF
jgi:hypothetical protein